MLSATFFGHRDFNYSPYRERLQAMIIDLVENHDVKEFYNGFRGNFDGLCATIVFDLKARFPAVKNIMVLSYYNRQNAVLPKFFDESVYFLEKRVPPQYAISYTNQEMILHSNFIISGVRYQYGGAYAACEFAKRHKKFILDLFEDK